MGRSVRQKNPALDTPAVIVNVCSAGGVKPTISAPPAEKSSLSGALTANTLATVLSISGVGGTLNLVATMNLDNTSRTIRIKITLDGVSVFDATSSAITTQTQGLIAVGYLSDVGTPFPNPVPFKNSCLVQIASSITETDLTRIYYSYRTNAT